MAVPDTMITVRPSTSPAQSASLVRSLHCRPCATDCMPAPCYCSWHISFSFSRTAGCRAFMCRSHWPNCAATQARLHHRGRLGSSLRAICPGCLSAKSRACILVQPPSCYSQHHQQGASQAGWFTQASRPQRTADNVPKKHASWMLAAGRQAVRRAGGPPWPGCPGRPA